MEANLALAYARAVTRKGHPAVQRRISGIAATGRTAVDADFCRRMPVLWLQRANRRCHPDVSAAVDRGTATGGHLRCIGHSMPVRQLSEARGPSSNTPSPSIVPTFRPASISASMQRQQHDSIAALVSLRRIHASTLPTPRAVRIRPNPRGRRQDEAATPYLEQAISSIRISRCSNDLAMALQRLGRQQDAIPCSRKP